MYATLLNQRGYRTLLYEGSDDEAYLTVSDSRTPSRFAADGRVVVEYGGTETGVKALLGYVLSIYDQSSLTLYAHPSHPMTQAFIDQSNDWRLLTHRMVNIHDLETVLSGFTEQLSSRWRAAPATASGTVTLAVKGGETVRLSYDAGSVTVEATEGPADIYLDQREMTRLLFGFGERQTVGQQDPLLQSVLPLEFYLWRSEWL
jgi:hypothetical protein